GALLLFACGAVSAQQICTADLDASGALDQPGESRACTTFGGLFSCPIQAQACVDSGAGTFTCPSDPALGCQDDGSGAQMCSPHACIDRVTRPPVITNPPSSDPTPAPVDAVAGCMGQLRIFSGYSQRCRRAGTQTVFQSCCSDGAPKSISDTMGEVGERAQQG